MARDGLRGKVSWVVVLTLLFQMVVPPAFAVPPTAPAPRAQSSIPESNLDPARLDLPNAPSAFDPKSLIPKPRDPFASLREDSARATNAEDPFQTAQLSCPTGYVWDPVLMRCVLAYDPGASPTLTPTPTPTPMASP